MAQTTENAESTVGESHSIAEIAKKADVKLGLPETIMYTGIDIGYNMMQFLVMAMLAFFLTDFMGVSGAFVSGLLLFTRVFDAINDPIIGAMADRTTSRWGRYKPWITIGSIASVLSITAMFSMGQDWSTMTKMVWIAIMYNIMTITMTSVYVPLTALTTALTSNDKSRTRVVKFRNSLGNISSSIGQFIMMPMILMFSQSGGRPDARGIQMTVLILCLISLVFNLIGAKASKERFIIPKIPGQKYTFGQQLKVAAKNPHIFLCLLAFIQLGFNAFGRSTVNMYYFTHHAGNAALFGRMAFFFPFMLAGPVFGFPFLHKLAKSKGRATAFALIAIAIIYSIQYFLDPNEILWWAMFGIGTFFSSTLATGILTSIPDVGDRGELISGRRDDAFIASFTTLGLKIGMSAGPAIMIAIYTAAGYDGTLERQTDSVRNVINMSLTIIPAIAAAATAVVLLIFWRITDKSREETTQQLMVKRAERSF